MIAPGGHAIALSWGASGDDGLSGQAHSYDLRYSNSPINEVSFDTLENADEVPASVAPGGVETHRIIGLDAATDYYVAVKAVDDAGNHSALSNVVIAHTLAPQTIFSDDFESGSANWTMFDDKNLINGGLWHLSTHRYSSATTAFYYGDDSSLIYKTGNTYNAGSLISKAIDLTGYVESSLRFTDYLQTENVPPYDGTHVLVSDDGGSTWQEIYTNALSTSGGVVTHTLDLSDYDGSTIRLRFAFDTIDGINNSFEGWVVDDVEVSGTPYVDSDGDGRSDNADNCTVVINADQRDTDHDGYGNVCDADLNNDGKTNLLDFGLFKESFRFVGDGLDADVNGDGRVNILDFGLFKQMFRQPPGPSGLVP